MNTYRNFRNALGCLLLVAASSFLSVASAQTNPPPDQSSVLGGVSQIGKAIVNAAPTNFVVAPYATYAPDAPTKVGGGVLALWNFNEYVGAGMGLDYLGQFWMPSASVQLRLPVKPLAFMGWTNFTATPFTLAGIATPLGGAGSDNRNVASILGAGASADVCKLFQGHLAVGGALVKWTGAGDYSGNHYQIFVAYRQGF